MISVDDVINSLQPGVVRLPDETGEMILPKGLEQREGYVYCPAGRGEDVLEADVDQLFGPSKCYVAIKNENITHRLILWMSINGHKPREIATALRVSYAMVSGVRRQPWFQQAFCKIVAEKGGDEVQTLLQGEVVATVQKLVDLRDHAESEQVQLAAADKLLDRIRGKPTVHVRQEVKGEMTHVVADVQSLLEEQRKNAEVLKSRGIGTN